MKHPEKFFAETGIAENNRVSFKTIRLPINPNNLQNLRDNTHFRLELTLPNDTTAGNGAFCKEWGTQACVKPLNVKESLYQLIAEFKKQNIRVLVDFHQTPVGRNGNVVAKDKYSLEQYKSDVAQLAKEIKET